jgi:hypothetical protein
LICITSSLETHWVETWKSTGRVGGRGLYTILLGDEDILSRDVDQALNQLKRSGIQARVIYTSQIRPIEASYGVLRRWEFKTLPTGKTIVLRRPRAASSAPLSGGL